MGQVLHGSATTTEAVRRAIQNSQESLRALSRRYVFADGWKWQRPHRAESYGGWAIQPGISRCRGPRGQECESRRTLNVATRSGWRGHALESVWAKVRFRPEADLAE
ncbi:hypothetical protein CA260_13005 [Dyella jiangningensis]|uniref:Uncharacterized protein n=1 Tax=Dyella jiangningensis TaxID=1379159 RepID=A0A328P0W0_9GAMM|nr:hypothetical protein CA260_13005 [Dyella jiangningensis]